MTKLKGKNSERIEPKKKAKMQKTLDKMINTRKKDAVNLRYVLESKLIWAKEEEAKAKNSMQLIKAHLLKLQGAIVVLEEVLGDIENKKVEK